jgi:lysophospholipase L1-like esterase
MAPGYPRPPGRTRRRAVRRRSVAIALTLVVALVASACSDDDWVTPPATAVVVGDSLVFQSSTALREALEGKGWDARLDGRPGSGIVGGETVSGRVTVASWPVRIAQLVEQFDPDAVFVVLGTNGCECRLAAGIDAVMEQLRGVPRVFWLNVKEDAPIPDDPKAVNEALDAAAGRYGNLDIVDLDDHFDDRPELIHADGIHFNDAGEREFAALIADELPEPPAPDDTD